MTYLVLSWAVSRLLIGSTSNANISTTGASVGVLGLSLT